MSKTTNIISRTKMWMDTKLQNADVETLIVNDSEKLNGFVKVYIIWFLTWQSWAHGRFYLSIIRSIRLFTYFIWMAASTWSFCTSAIFLETQKMLVTKIDHFKRCNYSNLYCGVFFLFFLILCCASCQMVLDSFVY